MRFCSVRALCCILVCIGAALPRADALGRGDRGRQDASSGALPGGEGGVRWRGGPESGGKRPERVVSLSPSVTEILYALGADRELVGVTSYCNYPPEALEKTRVGGFSGATVSVETIAALRPDLVIVSGEMHGRVVELLDGLGIPSLAVEPESFSQVYDTIRLLAALTGHEESSQRVIALMQEKIDRAVSRRQGEAPAVFWEVWDNPLLTAGGPTLINEAIHLAGGRNIFGDLGQRWPEVSYEEVLRRRPQWIFSSGDRRLDAASLSKRPSWSRIPAVEAGRIALINADLINRYGPRLADAVLLIAETLYP